MNIEKILKNGEGQKLEFKQSFSEQIEILETICAFANTKGGKILIGISDGCEPLGVKIGKDTLEKIPQKIKESFDPNVFPSISVEEVKGKQIVAIEVAEAHEKPVFCKNVAYKRVGRANRKLSASEVRGLAKETSEKVYWDEEICKDATIEDVDEEKVKWFLKKAQSERNFNIDPKIPLIDALKKLKLIVRGKLTNASILLFGKKSQQFFSQAETRCARFKGTEPLEFIDMKVFAGNIIDQKDDAVEFVKEHIKLHAKIVGTERVETWEYPIEAIREGISNAICHRDYEIPSSVQVRIFDDRIEIWNPGTLAEGLTIEKLKGGHESILRNPLIGKCFFLIKFIEQWGTGTNRIIRETLNYGLPEPVFEDTKTSFVLTFRKYMISDELLKTFNERQQKSIEHIKEKGAITTAEYQSINNIGKVYSVKELNEMVAAGAISRTGKGRSVKYVLK